VDTDGKANWFKSPASHHTSFWSTESERAPFSLVFISRHSHV
jgi:hypothetical protein